MRVGPSYLATVGIWAVGVYALNAVVGVMVFGDPSVGGSRPESATACATVALLKPRSHAFHRLNDVQGHVDALSGRVHCRMHHGSAGQHSAGAQVSQGDHDAFNEVCAGLWGVA